MAVDIRKIDIKMDGNTYGEGGSPQHGIAASTFAFAAVQVIPVDSGITGTIELKRSICGNHADAVSFASGVQPSGSTKAIIDEIDIRDIGFLHITTTSDGSKRAEVYIHLSEA